MSETKSTLIYDIIARVVELCCDGYHLLFQCSLVNWEFNRAASRVLYSRVAISPQFKAILDLRDTGSIPESSNFQSATLPQYASYVHSLEVRGFMTKRRTTLPETIAKGIVKFISLRRLVFAPITYHEDLFVQVLHHDILSNLRSLTDLTVNKSCMDEGVVQNLVAVNGLKRLTLFDPGRAILQLLPDWLRRLSPTLTELHLKNNCGSVTPGVLKSFTPHVENSLEAFTLGLSYSLTDNDVFTFLGGLSKLKSVHLSK
ncbi:hypothetical protein M413DRAFT_445142 [Hebeloma cylindrosporum]|uniref:F-box domain-containing protein n=1 Tax=Hebeloma cylindrosporum TaxID=76867 RepID=A0A0C3BZC5_HEBCY|nr:hypothetical protein M413DRAFT_445142 [Hebeloma cylindrosporum h7]